MPGQSNAGPADVALTVDFCRIDLDVRIALSERIDCVAPNVTPDAADGEPLGRGHLDVSAACACNRTRTQGIDAPLIAGVVLVGLEESNTPESAVPRHRAILTTTWKDRVFSGPGRPTCFANLPYDALSPIGFNGRFVHAGARRDF